MKTALDHANDAINAASKRRNARYRWTITFTKDIHPNLDGHQIEDTADDLETAQVRRAAQSHFGLTLGPLVDTSVQSAVEALSEWSARADLGSYDRSKLSECLTSLGNAIAGSGLLGESDES